MSDILDKINLSEHNIQTFYGCLFLHDFLWFSSSEISRISTTIPVIHNYALTYAINQFSYAIYQGNTPRYFEDLEKFSCYSTPARSFASRRESIMYNAIDDLRQTPGRDTDKYNSPKYGFKTVLVPEFASRFEKENPIAFKFYLFTFNGFIPPSVVRLGKKNIPARIYWEQIQSSTAQFSPDEKSPSHPVNPLDVNGEITGGIISKIPPHSFYRYASIKNDWFIEQKKDKSEKHIIQIPKRILQRMGLTNGS
ncbi:MAG TPA: type I-D CRISPR-associated protein Cas5/Csc1 [candidate division WOR-3 bacterium]|uniref:Type I-D CRISPR-associated protein Cas5/Csc1 n=1 Tax=candidate division WOR-3 bacterium TaxID=2052148 RepID=A0A9C9K0R5_UNCW3|nr:type I-D CRISPR-associated protein Cas5/Csc1 [candidate division WOR-3 bacterium]